MANIRLDWKWIDWQDNRSGWKAHLLPQIIEHGISEEDLQRSVYVIRLNVPFAIKYPQKTSPVLYIGEGDFKTRISSHLRQWIPELQEIIEQFGLHIGIAMPRARNNPLAYRDVEADLIWTFAETHGSAPLRNKQFENSKITHQYEDEELRGPLLIGKGMRYKWEISPLPSNPFYEMFHQTHLPE